ncbi:MAG: amino acid--tRNA ligase-related protein [Acidobacteriota bacterium]
MSELDVQIGNRRDKRDQLRERGESLYPTRFDFDHETTDIHARFGEMGAEDLEAAGARVRVPGRITAFRKQGKLVFADLHDGKTRLQLFLRKNNLDDATWERLLLFDIGDWIGVGGTMMRTRKGELSIAGDELVLLSKALRPMPEKWSGLKDVELRYRQRYLDLMSNADSRRVFEVRAQIVRGIRRFLDDRGFLEVETPMMQAIAGGASARPFVTHHNALDIDLYLRIAPELYLKRLLVGSMPRVYEINRNFRNEGISTQHNPEFTMLEFYFAHATYDVLMDLTETMLREAAIAITGSAQVPHGPEGEEVMIDFEKPFRRIPVREGLLEKIPGLDIDDAEALKAAAKQAPSAFCQRSSCRRGAGQLA